LTKFGSSIDFELWVTVTSSNTEPEVVWSRRGRHLKIVYDVITPLRVAQFGRKLGTLFGISHKLLRYGQNRKGKKNFNRKIENPYFFVCLIMHFGFQRAAAFVSSPIHLLNIVTHMRCACCRSFMLI